MNEARIHAIEEAITAAEATGVAWTNRVIYEQVGGHKTSLSAYLKQRRAQSQGHTPRVYGTKGERAVPVRTAGTRPRRISAQEAFDRRVLMAPMTLAMIDFLETCHQDVLYAYSVVNRAVGANVQHHLPKLMTARLYMLDVYGRYVDLVPNKGLIWVTEAGKLAVTARERSMVHNKLTKSMKINASVDLEVLPLEERPAWVAAMSTDSAAAIATDPKTVRTVIEQKDPQPLIIDPRQYREVFQGLLAG